MMGVAEQIERRCSAFLPNEDFPETKPAGRWEQRVRSNPRVQMPIDAQAQAFTSSRLLPGS